MAQSWNAKWIGFDYDPRSDLGIFVFRCLFDLKRAPQTFPIKVSADQRYRLYCNGTWIGLGPCRGDLEHWFFESYDLAPHLKIGNNIIHAVVWNFGRWAPMAQISARTGFVLEGSEISTPSSWEVAQLKPYDFAMLSGTKLHGDLDEKTDSLHDHFYIDVGPGEIVDYQTMAPNLDILSKAHQLELQWKLPHEIAPAEERGILTGSTPWMLIPPAIPWPIPQFEPKNPTVTQTNSSLLLDFQELLCAYPKLTISGTPGTKVVLTYAEGLWNNGEKGNRNETTNKKIAGYEDHLILGQGPNIFEPLWWRTFRYIQVDSEEPIQLHLTQIAETGYPLNISSQFESSHPISNSIWNVSIRTLKRCAGETYFDCPYYEQLQYVGDSRIQALTGYFLSKDRRLQRHAIESIRWSLMDNGLTQSRYPSRQTQIIPPFSLWWVLMLYDQMLHDNINPDLRGIQGILEWWSSSTESETYWCFADWVPEWRWGVPPGGKQDPIHLETLRMAKIAFECLKSGCIASELDPSTKTTLHNDPPNNSFESEHARALFLLNQRLLGSPLDRLPGLSPNAPACTFYFKYYDHLARLPENYFDELAPWQAMIDSGLTTFAENPEPARSDCHAWSAHPALGFLQIVAGVTSIAPGWARTKIEPRPGNLEWFSSKIDHPIGPINVNFQSGRLQITTPTPTEVHWNRKVIHLAAGYHEL